MNYVPDLPEEDWARVRVFVLAIVADVRQVVPYALASLLNAVAHHVDWAANVAGYPMTREALFRRDLIGLAVAMMPTSSPSTKGRRRSLLLRVGEALGVIPTEAVLHPLSAATPTTPYTDEEIERLETWAYIQRTEEKSRSARALVALGLGAGLPTRDIGAVRAVDVHDGGRVVGVSGRAVRVRQRWVEEIHELSNTATQQPTKTHRCSSRTLHARGTSSRSSSPARLGRVCVRALSACGPRGWLLTWQRARRCRTCSAPRGWSRWTRLSGTSAFFPHRLQPLSQVLGDDRFAHTRRDVIPADANNERCQRETADVQEHVHVSDAHRGVAVQQPADLAVTPPVAEFQRNLFLMLLGLRKILSHCNRHVMLQLRNLQRRTLGTAVWVEPASQRRGSKELGEQGIRRWSPRRLSHGNDVTAPCVLGASIAGFLKVWEHLLAGALSGCMTCPDILTSYVPAMPHDHWVHLQPFVTNALASNTRTRSATATSQALIHLTGFADWVEFTGVAPLNSTALTEVVIDAYTQHRATEVKPNVAERERKVLRDVAGLPRSVESRLHSTTSPTEVPYTANEKTLIHAWARHQRDEPRLRNALALATLGLGAGLKPAEVMQTRVHHILLDEDSLPCVVASGRTVPVRTEWVEAAQRLRTVDSGCAFLVAPDRKNRRPSSMLEALRAHGIGAFVPTPQRMRNTWLVDLMNESVPTRTILEASGLSTAYTLLRLAPFTRVESAAERLTSLRGA